MRCLGYKPNLLVGFAMCGAVTEAIAQSPALLAQVHSPVHESYMVWVIRSLGLFGLLTLLAGAAVFLALVSSCSWHVVRQSSRPTWSFFCCRCCSEPLGHLRGPYLHSQSSQ